MKKNFDSHVKNLDGTDMVDPKGNPQRIADFIAGALANFLPHEQPQPEISEKLLRGNLAQRVYLGGEQEYTSDELGLMKKTCGLMWGAPIVLSQIVAAIDNDSVEPAAAPAAKQAKKAKK